jgi:hypothetical protein
MKKETAYSSTSKDFLANLNVKNKVTEVILIFSMTKYDKISY